MPPYRCWCSRCGFQVEAESEEEVFDMTDEHLDDFGLTHKVHFEVVK